MDSRLNHRHASVHTADLDRRAELHRQVAVARAERRARMRPSLLAPPALTFSDTVVATMGRVGRRLRHPIAASHSRAA